MAIPYYSIIIPTFNSSRRIINALESLVNQTYKNFEVRIIDGKSTDDTLSSIKSFNDLRINLVSASDSGPYDAMNNGIIKAKGEWIFFLGSDDELFDQHVLERVHSFLSSMHCDMVYGNAEIIGDAGWNKGEKIYGGAFTLYRLLKRNICHQAIFYNRAFVMKHRLKYDLKYPVSADWDFNLQCWLKGRCKHIDLTIARFNAGGISSDPDNYDAFRDEMKDKYSKYFSAPYKSSAKRLGYTLLRKVWVK